MADPTDVELVTDLLERVSTALGLTAEVRVEEIVGGLVDPRRHRPRALHRPSRSTIDAVRRLAQRIVHARTGELRRVVIDAEGYRARRQEALERQADEAAADAVANGRAVALDAMTASERRLVHEYLRERGGVDTHSEGNEPDRHLVVTPAASRRGVSRGTLAGVFLGSHCDRAAGVSRGTLLAVTALAERLTRLCADAASPASSCRASTACSRCWRPTPPHHDRRRASGAVEVHVADALDGLELVARDARRVADVGASRGLPGLILALCLPEAEVALVESVGKKCDSWADSLRPPGSRTRCRSTRGPKRGRRGSGAARPRDRSGAGSAHGARGVRGVAARRRRAPRGLEGRARRRRGGRRARGGRGDGHGARRGPPDHATPRRRSASPARVSGRWRDPPRYPRREGMARKRPITAG